jgi:hypothetical protein
VHRLPDFGDDAALARIVDEPTSAPVTPCCCCCIWRRPRFHCAAAALNSRLARLCASRCTCAAMPSPMGARNGAAMNADGVMIAHTR